MIFEGITGGRWTASSILISRPSWARRGSSRRITSTTLPSSRIRRVSRILPLSGGLAQVFGIGFGAAWAGGAGDRSVEPDVYLAVADRVFVFAVLPAGGRAVAFAERAQHHQVVPEPCLRLESVE